MPVRKPSAAALVAGLALAPAVLVSCGAPQEQPPRRPLFITDVELGVDGLAESDIPLSTLVPGSYRLRVTAVEGGRIA